VVGVREEELMYERRSQVMRYFGLRIVAVAAAAMMFACPVIAKPVLKVTSDGFPTGHSTPEGVACDLARAFIKRDTKLFLDTCYKPDNSKADKEYKAFLDSKVADIRAEAKRKKPSPSGPKEIGVVFAVRHLSTDGPASYAYAGPGWYDLAFVDVGIVHLDGRRTITRTMVLMDSKNRWFVHPAPTLDPFYAVVNDESNSTVTIWDTYDLVPMDKPKATKLAKPKPKSKPERTAPQR
jgi:hypothetical protein